MYKAVYAFEQLRNGGKFIRCSCNVRLAKFGNEKLAGEYALNTGADGASAFKYKNYTTDGVLSQATDPMVQIREKTQGPDAFMSIGEALAEPDLYAGEDVQLQALQKTFVKSGRIGAIPPVYYEPRSSSLVVR